MFYVHAADGCGTIDREELAPLLEQLGFWVSAEMAREVFPRLDLDCSGDIRQEELVAWLEKVSTDLPYREHAERSAETVLTPTHRLENISH